MVLNSLNQRVKEVMKYFDLDQTGLANITKVTRQTANGIILGKAKPGATFLIVLLTEFKDIDARWLLTGEGEMLSATSYATKKKDVGQERFDKEAYANLRRDFDNLRDDIQGYKKQIEFLQSLIAGEDLKKRAV